ncbi:MAG: glycosyltransferase family 2 protein [Janthinobacterium lividum]
MNPLVSVIIPSYNHAEYLQERINSVLHQSYTNFEVIILDDASQDESKEIIEQHNHNFQIVHQVFNIQNSGSPFLQWKKGIELAQGKYIWIAESDDTCNLFFLETLTSILENNSSLLAIYVDSERDIKNWTTTKFRPDCELQIFEGSDFIKKNMLTSPIIVNASAVLFRKDAIKKDIFQFTSIYKTAFDWLFWCHILMQGKIGFYPYKLNFFRQHQQNTSLKSNLKGLFVTEGLHIIFYLKEAYGIQLNFTQIKTWASVWAQTSLLTNNIKNLFLKIVSTAWNVSPRIVLFYIYYLLKFKLISNPNIKMK